MDFALGQGPAGTGRVRPGLTLIDSRPAILASFAEVGRETGTPIDLAAVDRGSASSWTTSWRTRPPHRIERRRPLPAALPAASRTMTTVLPGAHEALAAVRAAGQQVIIITAKHPVSVGPSLRAVRLSADELFTLGRWPGEGGGPAARGGDGLCRRHPAGHGCRGPGRDRA